MFDIIKQTGFTNIQVQKEKRITLPDEILKQYLTSEDISKFKAGVSGIFSITVYAEKPDACCGPGCCNK